MSSTPSPFALHPDEPVGRGFVRVLGQLAIQARRLTRNSHGTPSESVHDTRVLIKRLRALLWFANPSFPASELTRAKAHLRKASHLLAAQRDFAVMRSIWKGLARKTSEPACRKAFVRMSRAPGLRQAATGKTGPSLRQAATILLTTIEQVNRRTKINRKWPSPSARLARAFRAGKKSEKKALRDKDPAQFHDWRKKTKRLLYQLQLTEAAPGKRLKHTIKRVDKLQKKLGDYHDSVVAGERLEKNPPGQASPQVVKQGVHLLEKRKRRLRKKVRKIARHIHPG